MKELTHADELTTASMYLEHGVLDTLIALCNAEPVICAVHERLKIAYFIRLSAMKKAISDRTLSRTDVLELEEIGRWAIPRDREAEPTLVGKLCDLLSNSKRVFTPIKRVRAEATQTHRGPGGSTSMSASDMLTAWQMYEDGLKWQEIASKFEIPLVADGENIRRRLQRLRRVVEKYCPLPGNPKQIRKLLP
jgi:hypothetical protein